MLTSVSQLQQAIAICAREGCGAKVRVFLRSGVPRLPAGVRIFCPPCNRMKSSLTAGMLLPHDRDGWLKETVTYETNASEIKRQLVERFGPIGAEIAVAVADAPEHIQQAALAIVRDAQQKEQGG